MVRRLPPFWVEQVGEKGEHKREGPRALKYGRIEQQMCSIVAIAGDLIQCTYFR